MPTGNLAQRAARWSARHRRIGDPRLARARRRERLPRPASVGLQNIKDEDAGNGESRQRRPGPGRRGVQRPCQRAGARAVRGRAPAGRGPAVPGRDRRRRAPPAALPERHRRAVAAGAGQRGADLARPALGAGDRSTSAATRTSPSSASAPSSTRSPRLDRAHPRAADRGVRRRERGQGAEQGLRGRLPQGRAALAPDHAAHPRRRLRRAGGRGHPAAAGPARRSRSRSACWRRSASCGRSTRRSRR